MKIRIPGLFQLFIVATFATASFVVIEPAPFDLLVILLIMSALATNRLRLSKSLAPLSILVLAFTAARLLSVLSAADSADSMRFFLITSYLSLSALALSCLISKLGFEAVDTIFLGLSVGMYITLAFVLLAFLRILPIQDLVLIYGETRAKGFFKDPNVMAPAMIPVCIFYLMKYRMKRSTICLATSLSAACLVILSFSRGAVITLFLSVVIFSLFSIKVEGFKSIKRLILASALLATSGVVIYLGISASNYAYLLDATKRETNYDNDRFLVHRLLLGQISTHPFGKGPGETNSFVQSTYALQGSGAAHNTYLRVAFENGWLGLGIYLSIIFCSALVVYNSIRGSAIYCRYNAALGSSLIASVTSALTVDTLHWRHFWVLIGLIWGVDALRKADHAR
jgi:O-antigen ligase